MGFLVGGACSRDSMNPCESCGRCVGLKECGACDGEQVQECECEDCEGTGVDIDDENSECSTCQGTGTTTEDCSCCQGSGYVKR